MSRLPPNISYAIELRNEHLFSDEYIEALKASGGTHCFSLWSGMPELDAQWAKAKDVAGDQVFVRWMLPRGMGHREAEERFAPFDHIVHPDLARRSMVATLALEVFQSKPIWVVVSNNAEGCAPASIRALAEVVAEHLIGEATHG